MQMTDKKYFDLDGNECSLYQLVRKEPGWAESRIKVGEAAIEERDALLARVEELEGRENEVRQAIERYYFDLDKRKHGGVAMGKALDAIENIMGMSWEQGKALKDKEAG